ncbi:hypothetical protein AAC387_Pa07g2593 [Persea americana]
MDRKSSQFLSLLLLLAIFSLFFKAPFSLASDTLSPGQYLSGNQTISSQDERFELGFFKSGNSTSQNYYIGIWYKKIRQKTPVWVANRDNPLPDTSSELKFSEDWNLVLLSQSKIPIWSSNSTSRGSNSTVAVLLETGNLVLRDGSNSSDIFWQSFDHPTDTWLPGGKLGLNKVTGENQVLYSWKNSENPARGMFSLEMDSNGSSQYYIVWNRSIRYWTSGVWNGQTFNLVPEMTANYIYNFSYVSNDKENYFTYTAMHSSLISRFVMDTSGQIQQLTWLEPSQQWILLWSRPSDRCEAYSLCGAFSFCSQTALPFCSCLQGFTPRSPIDWNLNDWSAGCSRRTPLQCESNSSGNGQREVFLMMKVSNLPENPQSLAAGSVQDCESACLNNCSCTAYAYGSQCSLWYGDIFDLRHLSIDVGDGSPLYIRLAASELPNSNGKKRVVIGIIAGVAGLVAILGMILVLMLCYRRSKMIATSKSIHGLVAFSYRDLQSATKNFSEVLGRGGFGSVFSGTLPDSTAIAVKKLEEFGQGEKQFRAEVSTIGTIQHVNLVRLRGFCSERSKRLLVYDYMPNGSLDSHLFRDSAETLDWGTRYQIALGTARGLAYLHEECIDCIIHCDIKPENILLDNKFCPKVADFGLAKLLGREFSRVLTTMRGTRGYLAPEWISGQAITPKADVFSFGMMLFEVISGRRNSEHSEDEKIVFFPIWAASRMAEGEVISLLDSRLEGNAIVEELQRALRVACWCIQDDENHRPSMGQVVQMLEGVLDVSIPPIPRSLQIITENQEHLVFFLESSSDRNSRAKDNLSTSSQHKSMTSTSS